MSQDSAKAQEVRAVLAKWTANDWRRGFAFAEALEGTLRLTCGVPAHEPLLNGAGALAMPVRTRLGQLELEDLLQALAPLAIRLEARLAQAGKDENVALSVLKGQEDVGPGLARLAACRLGLQPSIAGRKGRVAARGRARTKQQVVEERDLGEVLDELQADQSLVVESARRLLGHVESGRPIGEDDLAQVQRWNDDLGLAAAIAGSPAVSLVSLRSRLAERVEAASAAEREAVLLRTLRNVAEAVVTEGARVVLEPVLEEAAAADPAALDAGRCEAFAALHRLLSLPAWEVDDAEVDIVEAAFGRKVARVAVAEVALGGPPPRG